MEDNKPVESKRKGGIPKGYKYPATVEREQVGELLGRVLCTPYVQGRLQVDGRTLSLLEDFAKLPESLRVRTLLEAMRIVMPVLVKGEFHSFNAALSDMVMRIEVVDGTKTVEEPEAGVLLEE